MKTSIPLVEVYILDSLIANTDPSVFDLSDVGGTRRYFATLDPQIIKRYGNIISKSEEILVEYDIFFE